MIYCTRCGRVKFDSNSGDFLPTVKRSSLFFVGDKNINANFKTRPKETLCDLMLTRQATS